MRRSPRAFFAPAVFEPRPGGNCLRSETFGRADRRRTDPRATDYFWVTARLRRRWQHRRRRFFPPTPVRPTWTKIITPPPNLRSRGRRRAGSRLQRTGWLFNRNALESRAHFVRTLWFSLLSGRAVRTAFASYFFAAVGGISELIILLSVKLWSPPAASRNRCSISILHRLIYFDSCVWRILFYVFTSEPRPALTFFFDYKFLNVRFFAYNFKTLLYSINKKCEKVKWSLNGQYNNQTDIKNPKFYGKHFPITPIKSSYLLKY